MSSILEPFMFFFVSHNHVIYDCDICDHSVTGVTLLSCHTPLSKFKIIIIKIKPKLK